MATVLRVWSFHKSLTTKDKEDLLEYFGAVNVKHVGRRGQDNAVLASFKSAADCKYALSKLHQRDILGVRLKAIYKDSALLPSSQQPHKCKENTKLSDSSKQEKIYKKLKDFEASLCAIGPTLGINHPIPPNLRYLYPPPSPSVVANIAQMLVEVPKFYTQVLHLMNKMNLPPPFEPLTSLPPIYEQLLQTLGYYDTQEVMDACNTGNNVAIDTVENLTLKSSESESELESEGEDPVRGALKGPPVPVKRRMMPRNTIRKKPKLLLKQPCVSHPRTSELSVRDVFEPSESHGPRKLKLRLPGTVLPQGVAEGGEGSEQGSGFGKMESTAAQPQEQQPDEGDAVEWQREADKYITKEELQKNIVNKSDWPLLPVFKNYSAGEPSTKLYIKNLAKTTSEKDLKYIYGRYVFWQNNEEASLFSIRLMKEGRMKGQAFVTFPTAGQATEALQDTNGYILNDKPMVVAFGKVKSS